MAYADGESPEPKREDAILPRSECGMARAADLLGDRWTLLVVREALYGVTRFDAMQADLGAPRSVLSARLKHLCETGVMTKRPYKKPGERQRHQYVLTSKGVELALPLMGLMQWGDKHLRDGDPRAQIVERHSGTPCQVGLVNEQGTPVSIGKTTLKFQAA